MTGLFKRPLTVALVALNMMLGGWWAHRLWRGTESATLLATRPARIAVSALLEKLSGTDTSQVAVIQDRALFYPTRQFYVPPAPGITSSPKPDYRLLGTILTTGRPAVALLQPTGSAVTKRVRPGDDLEGWTVLAVERTRVRLRHDADQYEIEGATANLRGSIAAPTAHIADVTSGVGLHALNKTLPLADGQPTGDPGARLYRPPPSTQ